MTARRLSALSVPSAIGAILVLLGLLATLQYRWVGELGTGESARLRTEARNHADALTREFDLEVTRVFIGLQPNRGDALARGDFRGYAERYETWRRSTAYPSLVRDLFLMEAEGERLALARYDAARGTFEPTEWPSALDPVRRRTEELVRGPSRPDKEGPWPPPRPPGPIVEEIPALILFGFGFVVRGEGPGPEGPARGTFRFEGARAGAFPIPPPDTRRPEPRWPRPMVIVVLDAEAIRQRILPALGERHFGAEYDLTVVRQEDRRHVVWQSRSDAPRMVAPDAEAGLLDLRFEDTDTAAARRFQGARAHTADTGFWRLLVSHRAGPLDQVVAAARRRNLAVGFGILLLLGASVTLVVVSSQRARRLGERQMEFVAAVSHELRTPVAAICSTSENLADGIVAEPAQVRAYGSLIHAEGQRLADMVERVLEFAGTTRARPPAPPEDVEVSVLVDESLRPFESELREREFTLVREVAPDLPLIRGDAFALRRALQNLVENALKYDKGGRWLAVKAEPSEGGRAVRISVEDHGDGIALGELGQVFEPFFRGREARAAQAPGFGLGLALARRVAETHGGRLRVDSAAGRGTTFTLDLPGARRTAAPARPVTSAVVTDPDR